MTVLVIGATGTIGREVVSHLLASGREVRALTRDAARARHVLGDGVELVEGDLTSPAALADALNGIEGSSSPTAATRIPRASTTALRKHWWMPSRGRAFPSH